MPIYRYRCETCGYEFEDLGKWEEREKACPPCNSKTLSEGSPPGPLVRAARIPSVPAPAQFKCDMPTYQRKKT